MPKTFAQYSRYEGGLNFKTDDEDLDQVSLTECDGWDVNNPGEISTVARSNKTAVADGNKFKVSFGSTFNPKHNGRAAILARSDFNFGSSNYPVDGTEASLGNSILFIRSDEEVVLVTDIEGTPTLRTPYLTHYAIKVSSPASSSELSMFWHEGELRVADRLSDANTTLWWLGHLNRTRFSSNDTYNILTNKWVSEKLNLKAPIVPSTTANGNGRVFCDKAGITSRLPGISASMPNIILSQTTNAEDGTWESTEYEFGCTNIYKGNQESSVTPMVMFLHNSSTNQDSAVTSYLLNKRQYFTGVNISFKNQIDLDYPVRQTGSRIYIRKADSGKRWRLFLDCDFQKGIRRNTFDSIETDWTKNAVGVYHGTANLSIKNPSIETYEALTGVLNDEQSVGFASTTEKGNSWGLAKAVGRRVFYIRAKYFTQDDTTLQKLNDRVFYSQGGKPDVVPTGNWIDLGINDGDSFIAMESFAGRLVLFKRNKIYILNVANPNPMGWAIEQEIDNNGILSATNVLTTRYGVIWANNYGCFIFAGQQPQELSAKIGSTEWRNYLAFNYDDLVIGFENKTNQLFVSESGGTSDTSLANMWVYNFALQSWTRRTQSMYAKNNGFFNDLSGDLYYIFNQTGTNFVNGVKVETTPMSVETGSTYPKTFTLREDNFGTPGIQKRFYKIRIEVKNEAGGRLQVFANESQVGSDLIMSSANTDYVTKVFTFDPILETDKLQIKCKSIGSGGITIGNITLEYRLKRKRIDSSEGN
tara:strand:- start:11543 stop:13813 length:2271 start_codon:yes stop_codon:yes gene_type:complete